MEPKRPGTLVPILFGFVGVMILLGLGIWQAQRLGWKENLIAQIQARMAADPVSVPAAPSPDDHSLLRVRLDGVLGAKELHVLTSIKTRGPGFRVISPITLTDGRVVMIDLGYVPERLKLADRQPEGQAGQAITITGLLHWPDETDGFTPDPDTAKNMWFARDVAKMAVALGTEPIMIVAEEHPLGEYPLPRPPGVGVPNRHLEYALTWFGLAIVWAMMTVIWVRRLRQRPADTA